MLKKSRRWWVAAGSLFLLVMTGYAGGPPIVTVENLPDYFVVGQPKLLKFSVRSWCCGHLPLDGNAYIVRATAKGLPEVRVPATFIGKEGEYAATLALPHAGDWTISIEFQGSPRAPLLITAPLLPIPAVKPGAQVPVLSQVERGERLFIAKGCVTCHTNRELALPSEFPVFWRAEDGYQRPVHAPDLTGKKFAADDVRKFLANPAAMREDATMPDLNLNAEEIAALVALLNRERPGSL